MGEEKLIQVSFQIPPSALDSISRLAQQLRLLTQAAAGGTPGSERAESGSFDPERFDELRRGMRDPRAVQRTVRDIADAPAVSPEISPVQDAEAVSPELSPVRDAEAVSPEDPEAGDAVAVSAGVQRELADAKGAGDEFSRQPADPVRAPAPESGPQYTLPEERGDPLPPAGEPRMNRIEAGSTAQAEMRELALAAVQGEVAGGLETPAGAGFVVQTQPEAPQSRWSDITEELAVPGEAPLTAEAVSMALERDGRRYDNGFPLY